jgi:dihydropteroate synthase
VDVARRMLGEGATILDIGAVSSRPGAEEISAEEEIARLSPVVEAIRTEFPGCAISIDTWRSGVVKEMRHRYGIDMVNDISAGQFDSQMFSTMAGIGIPYVMMHMQGKPEDMQKSPEYSNVTDDILQFFGERVYNLKKLGINDMIIDPGFGFGKSLEQNYQLLRELSSFAMLELPLMVGISRKSMICNVLETDPSNALNGTTSAHMAALLSGASILRVHDVKEAMETVKIFRQIVDRPARTV